jgi:hypothetical protein
VSILSIDDGAMEDICQQMAKPMKKVVRKTVEEAVFLKEFNDLRIVQTKEYFKEMRVPIASMVRPPPPAKILLSSGQHVNVGEWVEIEHSYVVGTCSDGGVAVVLRFEAGLADVR